MEKLNKNVSLRSARNCTEYLHDREFTESPLFTREPPDGEKVRNYFYSPYLCKEHREEKKGEKILVPVRFPRTRRGERGHRGSAEDRSF